MQREGGERQKERNGRESEAQLHGLVAEHIQLALDLLQRLVQTLQIVWRQLDADGSLRLQKHSAAKAMAGVSAQEKHQRSKRIGHGRAVPCAHTLALAHFHAPARSLPPS